MIDRNKALCRKLWEMKEAAQKIIEAGDILGLQTVGSVRKPMDRLLCAPEEIFEAVFMPDDADAGRRDMLTENFHGSREFEDFWHWCGDELAKPLWGVEK